MDDLLPDFLPAARDGAWLDAPVFPKSHRAHRVAPGDRGTERGPQTRSENVLTSWETAPPSPPAAPVFVSTRHSDIHHAGPRAQARAEARRGTLRPQPPAEPNTATVARLTARVSELTAALAAAESAKFALGAELAEVRAQCAQQQAEISRLASRLHVRDEAARRSECPCAAVPAHSAHPTRCLPCVARLPAVRDRLQDATGCVRVVCRVRPSPPHCANSTLVCKGPTDDEAKEGVCEGSGPPHAAHRHPCHPLARAVVLLLPESYGRRAADSTAPVPPTARESAFAQRFEFDRVFGPETDQDEVFQGNGGE